MATLMYLLTLIDKIPASFWGVVIGSFFSITGVALTNRASDKRLRAQFEHEQKQKATDREMVLRKEIYLAAAEAVSAGFGAVGSFANLDIPNDKITANYSEKAPAIAKADVIAKTKMMRALGNFSSELNTIFFKLFARQFELIKEKNLIAALDVRIDAFGKARDRYLELIVQFNIDGLVDAKRWQTLSNNFEFEQKRANEAIAHHSEFGNSLYDKQLEFMQECISESEILGKLVTPLLAAVREELELPL